MGLRDEDFAWVPSARLSALLGVADTARRLLDTVDEGTLETDWDALSDALFTLDRGGVGWSGSSE